MATQKKKTDEKTIIVIHYHENIDKLRIAKMPESMAHLQLQMRADEVADDTNYYAYFGGLPVGITAEHIFKHFKEIMDEDYWTEGEFNPDDTVVTGHGRTMWDTGFPKIPQKFRGEKLLAVDFCQQVKCKYIEKQDDLQDYDIIKKIHNGVSCKLTFRTIEHANEFVEAYNKVEVVDLIEIDIDNAEIVASEEVQKVYPNKNPCWPGATMYVPLYNNLAMLVPHNCVFAAKDTFDSKANTAVSEAIFAYEKQEPPKAEDVHVVSIFSLVKDEEGIRKSPNGLDGLLVNYKKMVEKLTKSSTEEAKFKSPIHKYIDSGVKSYRATFSYHLGTNLSEIKPEDWDEEENGPWESHCGSLFYVVETYDQKYFEKNALLICGDKRWKSNEYHNFRAKMCVAHDHFSVVGYKQTDQNLDLTGLLSSYHGLAEKIIVSDEICEVMVPENEKKNKSIMKQKSMNASADADRSVSMTL